MSVDTFTLHELALLMRSSNDTIMKRVLKPGHVPYAKLSSGYRYTIPKDKFFIWFKTALESGEIYDILPGTVFRPGEIFAARDAWLAKKRELKHRGEYLARQVEKMTHRQIHIKNDTTTKGAVKHAI